MNIENNFRRTRPMRRIGLSAALLLSVNACASDQTDAESVRQVDYKGLTMAYVEPGSTRLIPSVPQVERGRFDAIPKVDSSKDMAGDKEAAPDKVKLALNKPVRLPAEFSSKASEGSGDTPDLACISLRLPEGTNYIGAIADGDATDDFIYFEPNTDGTESTYGAHVCFDARSSENVGTIAVVASTERYLK